MWPAGWAVGRAEGFFDPDKPKPIFGAKCTIITKSGETVHLLKNMEYLHDVDGEIIGGIESFNNGARPLAMKGNALFDA